MRIRHRWLLAVPFVLLALITVVGGWVNTTDAHAVITDTYTDKPLPSANVSIGSRTALTDANGEFTIPTVPRTAKYQVDLSGYLRTSAPVSVEQLRLQPLSVTLYLYDSTKTFETGLLKSPTARDVKDQTKVIATGNDSGQIIITPHPGKDAQVLLCADGFKAKTITIEGVLMRVPMDPGNDPACPPLPTPTPTPTPPATTPAVTPSPSAAPTPTPSPTP